MWRHNISESPKDMQSSKTRRGRAWLHLKGIWRRPENWRWHARCISRELREMLNDAWKWSSKKMRAVKNRA